LLKDTRIRILVFFIYTLTVLIVRDQRLSYILLPFFTAIYILYPDGRMRTGWIPVTMILATTFLGNLLFHSGKVIFETGPVTITDRGMNLAVLRSMRVAGLIVGAKVLTITTPVESVLNALKSIFHPLQRIGIRTDAFFETARMSIRILPGIRALAREEFSRRTMSSPNGSLYGKILAGTGLILPIMIKVIREPEILLPRGEDFSAMKEEDQKETGRTD